KGVKARPQDPVAQYGWQKSSEAAKPVAPGRRFWMLLGTSGGLLATVGLLIWLVLKLRPVPPTYLVLLGAGYENNLAVPHNAHGMKPLQEIQNWARDLKRDYHGGWLSAAPLQTEEHPDLLPFKSPASSADWWTGLSSRKDQTVLVY